MKSLNTLLKIAKRDLETLRRALAQKLAKQGVVEESILALQQQIAVEQQRAAQDYESSRAYAGYAILAGERRKALAAEALAIGAECDELRTLIADAHVEMRKFERLIELREEREQATRDKREAAELDEMATQRAGRRV
jgi:flagellar export protein FliJ